MLSVVALYKFAPLPDFRDLREPLKAACALRAIKGTLLLAPEGINGTIAGERSALDALLDALAGEALLGARFAGAEVKFSTAQAMPFRRLKVRLKKEIVTLGAHSADPLRTTGVNVDPGDWNDLISRDDVCVIDVRNAFEVAMGSFAGATDPGLVRFSDFRTFAESKLDPSRHRRIAMFCTGGIRCEKAGAYLLSRGFGEVYQLAGGILKYLETVPPEQSLWGGDCFVFDERIALRHGLIEAGADPGDEPSGNQTPLASGRGEVHEQERQITR